MPYPICWMIGRNYPFLRHPVVERDVPTTNKKNHMTMLIFCIETSRATFRIRHVAPTVDGFTGTHPKQAIR